MKRRKFIKIVAGASILALIASVVVISFEDIVKRLIRKETGKMPVDDQIIDDFVKEASKEDYLAQFNFFPRIFIALHVYLGSSFIPLPFAYKFQEYKDRIMTQFLLSTDLFFHVSGSQEPINYLRFYSPYNQSCSNPFTSLYHQS